MSIWYVAKILHCLCSLAYAAFGCLLGMFIFRRLAPRVRQIENGDADLTPVIYIVTRSLSHSWVYVSILLSVFGSLNMLYCI